MEDADLTDNDKKKLSKAAESNGAGLWSDFTSSTSLRLGNLFT